jgi:hypothetical protein
MPENTDKQSKKWEKNNSGYKLTKEIEIIRKEPIRNLGVKPFVSEIKKTIGSFQELE